ncbi:unnamed protein product [Heterobilharzia americana]|nr:unnamed protein product [Heterobilharzia americana]
MSASVTCLPSSISMVEQSTRIPRVDESPSSSSDDDDERNLSYESERESNDITEDEAYSEVDDELNYAQSSNKRHGDGNLKQSVKRRAHSPNNRREARIGDDADNIHEPLPGVDDDAVDIDVLERLRKMSKGAAKRVVKNPRPKLDPQRLLSNKGLPALLEDFKKVKFRGKGHEFQDLDKLLFIYEAWANRLVPRLNFSEVVERLENVGNKREIRVALHRLRDGIWPPYATIEEKLETSEDDSVSEEKDPELLWKNVIESIPKNTFNATNTSSNPNDVFDGLHSTDYKNTVDLADNSSLQLPQASTSYSSESRAEKNKRLALERLAARRVSSSISNNDKLKPPTNYILKNALKAAIHTIPSSNKSPYCINQPFSIISSSTTSLLKDSINYDTTIINNHDDDLSQSVLVEQTLISPNNSNFSSQSLLQIMKSPDYIEEELNLVIDLN